MSNNNTYVLNLAEYEAPKIIESKQKDWVTFGDNNSFFKYIIDRYQNSTTNNAVINAITHLINGRGLSALDASKKPNEYAQLMSMLSKQDVLKIVTDLYMFGQCAIQVHYNDKHDTIVKAYHIGVNLLAPQKCDKEGNINNYYYSDDWSNIREFPPQPIPAYGTSKQKTEIFYVRPYIPGMKYFAMPSYIGGIGYALLEEEIQNYLINDTQNGFSGTKVVNIIGEFTEEQQRQRSNQIQEKLTGSNGKKVIVSFSGSKDLQTEVTDIPLNEAPQHYSYLSTECTEKILLAHKVVSGLIFGVAKSSGFSSNADELKTATVLFDNMVIRPIQDRLIEAFDELLAFNKVSLKLYFKTLQPLEFIDLENAQTTEQVAEKTGTELSEVNVELNEILAKVDANQLSEDWVEVDVREASENDEELDLQLVEAENKLASKKTMLSKFINLISTGSPKPDLKSSQDKKVGDLKYFKVRYRYNGNKTPDRAFCKAMMAKQTRLFRKEDIDEMSQRAVNPGFGEFSGNVYDIFKFKGGARCHHKWERVTFMLDLNAIEKGYEQIGTRKAEIRGYKVTNPYQVSIYPNNLPLKGFSPNNKNLPSDV